MIFFLGLLLLLFLGRSIFLPLLLAVFIWYFINAIAAYYRKAMIYKKYNVWLSALALILAFATVLGLGLFFAIQIKPVIFEFISHMPQMYEKLGALGVDKYINVSNIGMHMTGIITTAATSFGMVLIYLFFMFIEQSSFRLKMSALFPNNGKQFKKFKFILHSIDANMKKYFFAKTVLSAATAVFSYILMTYMNVGFALVWAFLIFILNYIPTIGSFIAVVLPIVYSALVFDNLRVPLVLAIGLSGLQILFSNIIEPKWMGKTLNVSTLAILINLVFWGMLWGPIGAFFSVPLLVGIYVATAQFDKTRWIAILLSERGEIPDEVDE